MPTPRGRTWKRPCAAASVPLFSLEAACRRREFDVLAFNLSAELTYTNVLNMVDLAGVPVRGADRDASHPLVVAGGHCAFNPEPLADFVDAFVLGDGEEAVGDLTEVIGSWRASGARAAHDLLRALASVPGVYVPSCYEPSYADGRLTGVTTAAWRGFPHASRSGPSPTWGSGPIPSSSWCR